jgi:hyperosmotically inducible protein
MEDTLSLRIARTLALAVVFAAATAMAAQAANRPTSQSVLPDSEIAKLVQHRLDEKGIRGLHVAAKDEVVSLSGQVPSLWVEQQAVKAARETDDVRSVVNGLSVMRGESDQAVARDVARKIRHYVFYTIFDNVDIAVKNGAVTLTGAVTMPYQSSEIANLAAHVSGVQQVVNRIQALPVSPYDDQLRYRIASKIYRNPDFWNYGLNPAPPIHIVVDNGRVTLAGAVNSNMDKIEAGMIARSTFGVFSVDNELQIG